ncbi:spermidine/putrescine ABC transporter substrate-binding protein [Dethiosulfatarculus sandiegensis]|uniref:Spermidine/putrescine ABC transporter substrate-binding protein n=3 Tax=Dethiosulfatarculus sandiegensis TaxID=1429043 RepID=A0A0D2J3G2_9BACT|nr:spermidine/putrescine ABC transporter substrate-binding protein [Dethiosulfatarculus sandiegensis]
MDYKTTLTVCPYCGCGCSFYLETVDGRLTGTLPNAAGPVNMGKLCVKGWNVHEFVQSPRRLKSPLLKKGGELTRAGWDDALDYAADELKRIVKEHGPDSVAFLASAKISNEDNYVLQKFARAGVGTNNIDHCARL